uniref:Signal recognition particle 19 kDa protein n=1 Tax=Riptortus pedestris TaxID=329032 RepID=R4WDL8_RIPPE|nr:conserved hypothetical protein [Riptortus pedestris]
MTTGWSPDKTHSDRERWICIYPAYLNSKKTLAEGRRVPKEKGVENPTYQEIRDVLSAAGLKVGVENKLYCREKSKEMLYRGRIRVQIKNDNGSPLNPDFPTRESVMLHACAMIPKLKSRQGKHTSEPAQSSSGGGGGKKKGKGRR